MKAGLTREDYLAWFQAVDAGPFHSISCGERVHGPSYDMRVVLSAAAIATSRVEITPTIYVLPMHSAHWADGLYAWSGNGEREELARSFTTADTAWELAGREKRPYRLGGLWYTLADNGQQKLYDYVYQYLAIAGCEELFLVPATAELDEIGRLGDLLAQRI